MHGRIVQGSAVVPMAILMTWGVGLFPGNLISKLWEDLYEQISHDASRYWRLFRMTQTSHFLAEAKQRFRSVSFTSSVRRDDRVR